VIRRFVAWWRWRRLRPGLLRAAMLAEVRAFRHPNAPTLGPERNLQRLSDDLYKLYRGEDIE